MSHTPGPWLADFVISQWWGGMTPGCMVSFANPERPPVQSPVALCLSRDTGTTTAIANARLIAAAPDLLAALKAAMGWIEPDEHGLVNYEEARRDLAACKAAIAKAEEVL